MAFFSPYKEVSTTKRHLPHWEQPIAYYFVTFRLADSIPQSAIAEMAAKKRLWELRHPPPLSPSEIEEYHTCFMQPIHRWLDQGSGSCIFLSQKASQVLASAITHFDNTRYKLDEWVIMPNHVHIILQTITPWTLPKILHSWKSYTAHEINKLYSRNGKIWQDESYDHIIRSQEELERIRRYIRANPEKAGIKVHHASFIPQLQ